MSQESASVLGLAGLLEFLGLVESPAKMFLSAQEFKSIADHRDGVRNVSKFNEIRDMLNTVNPIDLDSIVIGYITRAKSDEPCLGCGKIHADGSTRVTLGMIGGNMTLAALVSVMGEEVQSKMG